MRRVGIAAGLAAIALLAACGGGGNSAAGVNSALVAYLQAQADYNAPLGDTSPATVTQSWVNANAGRLIQMRQAFEDLRTAAGSVDFPSTFEEKGEPSQATITEYLNATDAYIALNEQMQADTEGCISAGGTPYDCVMRVGVMGMSGIYPDVVQRAQNAALQLREEASIG